MALFKENELGKITISQNAIETIIAKQCQSPKLYDRIWLAPKSYIRTETNDDDDWTLYFGVYVKFGVSISEICTELADRVALFFLESTGTYPKKIVINVSGVKSYNLVKRNMDIIVDYTQGEPGTVSGRILEE